MNMADSSVWLEYLADGPNAESFASVLENHAELIVSTIIIYEVCKVVRRESGENAARQVYAAMHKGKVVEVDSRLALEAGAISLKFSLPMADSIILATAQSHDALLWTQDSHFQNLPKVKYFSKSDK